MKIIKILFIKSLKADFSSPKNFVKEIENGTLKFYEAIIQNLSNWKKSPPKVDNFEQMKNKIAIFGIIVQLAGLIYGIINKAEDIIVMCLIFMFVSTVALFDKKKK